MPFPFLPHAVPSPRLFREKKNRQPRRIPGLSVRFHPRCPKSVLSDGQMFLLSPIASANGAPNSRKPVDCLQERHTGGTLLSVCVTTYSELNGTEYAAYLAPALQVRAETDSQTVSVPHRSILRIFPASLLPPFRRDGYIIKNHLVGYIHGNCSIDLFQK